MVEKTKSDSYFEHENFIHICYISIENDNVFNIITLKTVLYFRYDIKFQSFKNPLNITIMNTMIKHLTFVGIR